MTSGAGNGAAAQGGKIWVTLGGLPLTIRLEWPFHQSTSGADFSVLHGDISLVGSDGLHAPVAVNLSQTVREVMPSLEPKDAEAPVINALRKEVDRRQIEFLKSGKLLPVAFSSRHYDFKRKKWVFGKASDEVMATFIERKVYWETKSPLLAESARNGAPAVWIGDPTDAQYLETAPHHLLEIAQRLVVTQGLISLSGESATATPALMARGQAIEAAALAAREELEKKHAYERG